MKSQTGGAVMPQRARWLIKERYDRKVDEIIRKKEAGDIDAAEAAAESFIAALEYLKNGVNLESKLIDRLK